MTYHYISDYEIEYFIQMVATKKYEEYSRYKRAISVTEEIVPVISDSFSHGYDTALKHVRTLLNMYLSKVSKGF